jgi:hypothetical protein
MARFAGRAAFEKQSKNSKEGGRSRTTARHFLTSTRALKGDGGPNKILADIDPVRWCTTHFFKWVRASLRTSCPGD